MKLCKSSNELVPMPNSLRIQPKDFYHGYHRQRKDNTTLHERYYYLIDADYGWKFDFLNDEDKLKFDSGKSSEINWNKYREDHDKMNENFSNKWKEFYSKHNDIISKYQTGGCNIMLGTHFMEGRSNGYIIISNDEEEKQLFEDMKSIGVEV